MPERARARFAQAIGLKTVVRLSGEEGDATWPRGVRAMSLPGLRPVMSRQMWGRWKAILEDRSNWPILVHCRMGAERTGVYVAHAETWLKIPREIVRGRLQKYGEGFWPPNRDLYHLHHSLRDLEGLGDVLPDEDVRRFLRIDDYEDLDDYINDQAEWSPS